MRKHQLPKSRYLVLAKNGYDGIGGLGDCLFGYDNPKSGLDKLKSYNRKNQYFADEVAYEILDTETMEYLVFNGDYQFEQYLESCIKDIKQDLINKQKSKQQG